MKNLTINGINLKNGKIDVYEDCIKVNYSNCISKEDKKSIADTLKAAYNKNLVFFRN